MYHRTQVIFVLALAWLGPAVSKSLPSYIPICHASDPEYAKCLLKSMEVLQPKLAKGIPKLRIPPMEPFEVPDFEMSADVQGVKGRVRVTEFIVHGSTNFVVNYFHADPKTMTANGSVTFPRLTGHSRYDVDGKLAGFSLKNKGFSKGNFSNIQADFIGSVKIQNTNGFRHFVVDKVSSNVKILGDVKLKLISANAMESVLVNAFNIFFEENREDIMELVNPIINDTVEKFFRQVYDSLYSTLPVEEIFPD